MRCALVTGVQTCALPISWSRAEEIMRVPPRAPARAKLTATLNAAGGIDALVTRIAVPATNHEVRARLFDNQPADERSEEHTSELQSLMRISYAVFCLKKKNKST